MRRAPVRRRHGRQGTTLVELVVSTTLLGIVLAMLAVAGGRVQRVHAALRATVDARRPLREGAMVVAAELRELSGAAGDVWASPAGDSALAVRTLVTRGFLCDGAPPLLRAEAAREIVRTPEASDTLWVLAPTATSPRWIPWRLASATPAGETGSCLPDPGSASLDDGAPGASLPPAWHIVAEEPPGREPALASVVSSGSPVAVRVTRRARYSLYRGGDGAWQLGYREWDGASAAFQGVQPVSGAYASASAQGGAGIRFGVAGSTDDASPHSVFVEMRAARAGVDLSGAHRARAPERQRISVGVGRP